MCDITHSNGIERTCSTLCCGYAFLPYVRPLHLCFLLELIDKEDIIDEVLTLFRANVLFRNFEVLGGADRTLIYLTLHVVQCLVKCEKIEDKQLALKELRALSIKGFPIPGETGWPLGGLFPAPQTSAEANLWRTYMKQAREELAIRLCDRLFDGPAIKNKWWQSFSKRKFMGKELKD